MAGTYTQSRVLPTSDKFSYFWKNGSLVSKLPLNQDAYCIGGQVTTSYRSGSPKGLESVEDREETELLSGRSYADRFSIYRNEYRRAGRSLVDTGHEFATRIATVVNDEIDVSWINGHGSFRYVGPVLVVNQPWMGPFTYGPYTPGNSQVAYYGPKAISLTAPTRPEGNLVTTLGEMLREGLPALRSLLERFSAIGGPEEFQRILADANLTKEFGIDPLIHDAQEFVDALLNWKSVLQKYHDESGRKLHRKWTFPPLRTDVAIQPGDYTTNSQVYPVSNSSDAVYFLHSPNDWWPGGVMSGVSLRSFVTFEQWRFSGAYTYHVNLGHSILDRLERLESDVNHLFGTRLGLGVWYDITPWSWLLDWNWNIGDNLANADLFATDNLVLLYGYLMRQLVTENTITCTLPSNSRYPGRMFSSTWKRISKERFRASPYGFSSVPDSYTDRQWAILGSLGITRGPKSLRRSP